MKQSDHIENILATLPAKPGVYIMKDAGGDVIYVGKAKVLKNRVRSYFRSQKNHSSKVIAMVQKIADIQYTVTDNETEALVLECNLIKHYMPHYNVLMKDNKQYPYVRINFRDPYPRVEVVRKLRNDGAKYYGPFLAATTLQEIMEAVAHNFPLRTCKNDIERMQRRRERPCLNYEIGRCCAPCAGNVTQEEYLRLVEQVSDFLSGKYDALVDELQQLMDQASERMDYEQAASYRDRMQSVQRILTKQKAAIASMDERDVFALRRLGEDGMIHAFFVRDGKINGSEQFLLEDIGGDSDTDILSAFLKQYYMAAAHIPREVLVPFEVEDMDVIQDWLSQKRETSKVQLHVPQRGDKKKLVELAGQNALEGLEKRKLRLEQQWMRHQGALIELAGAIGLPEPPKRLECYDISHTQGVDNVGSMVVFTDGKPDKSEYRRFRIKTVEGADDFKSMNEVLTRRLLRAMDPAEDSQRRFGTLPDLLVIDGGKGQLNSALKALEDVGMNIPAIGLAKRLEEIFLPGEERPILLDRKSPALHVLQRIRDEAHRFAITYHRSLRASRTLASELDAIEGIGKTRKKALLTHYKTIEQIKAATFDELAGLERMNKTAAQAVADHFARQQESGSKQQASANPRI